MNSKDFAIGSTGASLAGIAANHFLTERTPREKKDTDKQLAAAIVGANLAHLALARHAAKALEKAAKTRRNITQE